MNEVIAALDDATAKRVLATIARAKFPSPSLAPKDAGTPSAELRADLATAVGPSLSEGEVARLTLGVLVAEDPALRANVEALARGPRAQNLSPESMVAVVTAALVVLTTGINVSRNSKGKWSFKLVRTPLSDEVLKALTSMASRLLPGSTVELPTALPEPSADATPASADAPDEGHAKS